MRKGYLLLAYGTSLLTYLILDAIWLGFVAKKSYLAEMQGLLRDDYIVWPWFVFYLTYVFAIVHLAIRPHWRDASFKPLMFSSATLGLASYGAYNLTVYSIIDGISLSIALKDWAWGICVTTASALCGGLTVRAVDRR